MRVALLLAGDELVEGHRADTNGSGLARALTALGAHVETLVVLRDEPEALARCIRELAARVDLIVISGGIGPTEDDRTREALGLAARVPLAFDESVRTAVAEALAARGIDVRAEHRHQAMCPQGSTLLTNPAGVAPGVRMEIDRSTVMALPGVPSEFTAMVAEHIHPFVAARVDSDVATASIFACGVTEPQVAARTRRVLEDHDVRRGFYPHAGEVEVRCFARGSKAATRVAAALSALRAEFGPDGYEPASGERIEHVVVRALIRRGWTVSTAESLTGGLLAHALTRVPGASAVLRVGWVCYASEEKTARLGVPAALIQSEGVVSAAVAADMAERARILAQADVALSTTGAAGPGAVQEAGREPTPAGRFFAGLAVSGEEPVTRQVDRPVARSEVQRRAVVAALDLLRRRLAE
ncbi:MAG: nicotinamide-nucleotide amidohydrolase family protein [bacterium]|nr:nicotinamide-nucleotide amidohydrolase family protein [bacterium]